MRAAALLPLCTLACVIPDYGGQGISGTLSGALDPADRVAIVWNNWATVQAPAARYATVVEAKRTGSGFSFDTEEPPPESALQPTTYFEPQGRSGRLAYGTVVAYRDTNGNGLLDTIPANTDPIDRIDGVSIEYFLPTLTMAGWDVRYVEGDPPDSPPGLRPGYNVLHDGQVTESLRGMQLAMRPAAIHNLYVCEEMVNSFDTPTMDRCIGPGPTRVYAYLTRSAGNDDVWVQLSDNGVPHPPAEVFVNGNRIDYDSFSQTYLATATAGMLLRPGELNNVIVREADGSETRREVYMDPDLNITAPIGWPSIRWSDPVTVQWSPAAADTPYYVRQAITFADGSHSRSVTLTGASQQVFPPLLADPGADLTSTIRIYAMRQLTLDEGDQVQTFVYQTSRFTITR